MLKFEQEPNYKQCIGYFEGCMSRHNFDPKLFDYTWKQNRLSKDKEALKASLLNIIHKKPKKGQNDQNGNDQGYKKQDQTELGVTPETRHEGIKAAKQQSGNRGSEFKKGA